MTELSPDAYDALMAIVPVDRILRRPIERMAFASDASFYRLVPQAVVVAASIDEVKGLLAASRRHRVPLAFRAAGTSLSGQAITDGLLVEVARHWRAVRVEDDGRRVRVQPGVIGGHANRVLSTYGTRIGPDPASINACTMGGILANNSSGMCCGVTQNAYHTLESLTFVLPSGTVIDTARPDADDEFRQREPDLALGLLALKREVEGNPALAERIRAKYRTKNTTGYSLNALVDFDRPVDIMRHLLVGSEGTLGFIAEAVLRTVPDLPVKYTGLLLFPSLHAACATIVDLRDAGAVALELMDRAALRSIEREPDAPPSLPALPPEAAGLLVEFQAEDEGRRHDIQMAATGATGGLDLLAPPRFTHVPAEQAALWHLRKGMFPAVGAVRKSGTTVIIEDVAFPVDRLADAAVDLTRLFRKHGYDNAIVFGHAKDGNLHFVLTQSFNTGEAVDQYARFIGDVVELVVGRYDGALKAEHGTGRNMAPFVETEWGPEAVAVMRRIKALADPDGLLNPGVILNPNPVAHVTDLKPLPTIEPEVDLCTECGFCEPLCPSRSLTLTPRQRIVVRRAMATLDATGQSGGPGPEARTLLRSLERDAVYMALDTCAVDGLCATACPVHIDTGQLTRRLRGSGHSPRARRTAEWCAEHFALVERSLRVALGAGKLVDYFLNPEVTGALVDGVRALAGNRIPRWTADVPARARPWHALLDEAGDCATSKDEAAAVYFPTCITRAFAPADPHGGAALPTLLCTVARRAGRPLWIPEDAPGTCCGVPFSSKGFADAHRVAASRAVEHLWRWSDGGRLPVVVDTSPCTYGLRSCGDVLDDEHRRQWERLRIVDSVEFVHDTLLPRLAPAPVDGAVVLHPVCSVVKMGLEGKLRAVGAACAREAIVPLTAGCCGFAGDRGFLVPELTASALADEASQVRAIDARGWYSSSRTCEIGLTRATGRTFTSFLALVERVTRAGGASLEL